MKFVSERGPLLVALQRAARIADRGGTIPILTHLVLTASKGKVLLVATDRDRWIDVEIAAQVDKPGTATADAQLLAQFVAGLADGLQVEVSATADKLTVRAGRARCALPTLPVADFPAAPALEARATIELEGKAFAEQLRAVAHAQSNEETRYYLNGIYLHRRGPRELVAVATDGHRLARAVLEVAEDLPDFPAPILPRAVVAELVQLAAEAGTIEIEIAEQRLRAHAGDVALATRLVDGVFPDYERVMPPADVTAGFEVERAALIAAAKRVGVFVNDDKIKSRPLKLSPDGHSLELLAHAPDHGEIVDELDAQTSTKEPIGMNAKYLQSALDGLGGKTVRVRYHDALSPIAFTDPADPSRTQIVMALRVS